MNFEKAKEMYSRKHLGIVSVLLLAVLGLYFVVGVGASNAPTPSEATQACEQQCSEIQEASGDVKDSLKYEYCKETFNIKTSPLEGVQTQEAETEYCTDGARCSNLHTCETDEIELNMQGCIDFMTQYHQETLGESTSEAEQHTRDLLSEENDETGVGSCEPKPEWYSQVSNE